MVWWFMLEVYCSMLGYLRGMLGCVGALFGYVGVCRDIIMYVLRHCGYLRGILWYDVVCCGMLCSMIISHFWMHFW